MGERLTIGDWKGDTVLHGHKQSGMVTLVERCSGYLLAEVLPQLKAEPPGEAIIRQYFPKGTDFRKVSNRQLRQTVEQLNDRLKKRLGYRAPAEVFWGEYSGALDTGGVAFTT